MTKTVLVTGGAGYIGSHTCQLLAKRGYKPVVYDNLDRGHREFVKWGPLVEGDLSDSDRLEKTLAEYKPIAVLHFAALAYVGESMRDPSLYYANNVAGSLSLLRATQKTNVRHIVFSSTCATYGVPDVSPISEQTPQNPVNPYGHTKKMVEQILRDGSTYGLRSIALRYFNAAGCDPQLEIGEWHEPETHLIPLTIEATNANKALHIFGTDYPTPDGTCVRDYIHVVDLADAHVRALERILAKPTASFEAMNLGTGKGASVREIIAAVEKVTGQKVHYHESPRRPGDPPRLVADAALAAKELGWVPQHSSLDSIVKTAVAWWQKQRSSR